MSSAASIWQKCNDHHFHPEVYPKLTALLSVPPSTASDPVPILSSLGSVEYTVALRPSPLEHHQLGAGKQPLHSTYAVVHFDQGGAAPQLLASSPSLGRMSKVLKTTVQGVKVEAPRSHDDHLTRSDSGSPS